MMPCGVRRRISDSRSPHFARCSLIQGVCSGTSARPCLLSKGPQRRASRVPRRYWSSNKTQTLSFFTSVISVVTELSPQKKETLGTDPDGAGHIQGLGDFLGVQRLGPDVKQGVNLSHRAVQTPASAHFPAMQDEFLLNRVELHISHISVTSDIT